MRWCRYYHAHCACVASPNNSRNPLIPSLGYGRLMYLAALMGRTLSCSAMSCTSRPVIIQCNSFCSCNVSSTCCSHVRLFTASCEGVQATDSDEKVGSSRPPTYWLLKMPFLHAATRNLSPESFAQCKDFNPKRVLFSRGC